MSDTENTNGEETEQPATTRTQSIHILRVILTGNQYKIT